MKSMMKLFVGVACAAVVLAVMAPIAEAQCPGGVRAFASTGGGGSTAKVRFDPVGSGAEGGGNEIGRWWECANSDNANNWGTTPNKLPDPGGCPISTGNAGNPWYAVTQTTLRGIEGVIDGIPGQCLGLGILGCPNTDMCVVVEDYDAGGPGAVGGSAYYMAIQVDPTLTAIRAWDLAKIAADGTTLPLQEFPTVKVVGSAKNGLNTVLNYVHEDQGGGVFVYTPGQQADSAMLASVDVVIHYGPTDPGRDRFNGQWQPLTSVAYPGTDPTGDWPAPDQVWEVDCSSQVDAWVAAGLTFKGGGGAKDVPSALVGQATSIQCNPDLADPEPVIRPSARPSRPRPAKPSARGGR